MNKKHLYYLAVIGLLILRILILNTNFPESLHTIHMGKLGNFALSMRSNPLFIRYFSGWILPVFVFATLIYWLTEEDEERIPKQFWFLPIAYLILCLIAMVLADSNIAFSTVSSAALAILPYGYVYIVAWAVIIWFIKRIRVAR